jgi:hypothetical protein
VVTDPGQCVGLDDGQQGRHSVQLGQLAAEGRAHLLPKGVQVDRQVLDDLSGWTGAQGMQVVGPCDIPVLGTARSVGRVVEFLSNELVEADDSNPGGQSEQPSAFRGVLPDPLDSSW